MAHHTPPSTTNHSHTPRLNPTDVNIPEIGDEFAVARALSDLAHQLLNATAQDIEAITHTPATIPR